MTLTRKVAFNTAFQIVAKVVTTALSLILIGALTRYLGVSGFGDYITIFAYVSFAAIFADFGFFWIMLREVSKNEKDIAKIVNNTMTLRGVIGIVVFSLAFVISLFIPQYSRIIQLGIAVISFSWFWVTLNSTYVGVFQSKLEMYKAAIAEVVGRCVIFALVMLFIHLEYSLTVILVAYAIGNFVNFIISMALGYKYVRFRLAFDFKFWKEIFWQALPMGIVLVLGLIYFKVDTIMLSVMKGSTDVGIYGAPYKILEVLQVVPAIFMGNVFPILTTYIVNKDNRIQSTLQKAFDFLVLMALPIIIGTIILAEPIISFVAGADFVTATTIGTFFGQPATAVLVLQILIVVVGISFVSIMYNNTVIALGKQKELVSTYIILVLVNVVLNFFWIPSYSYMGATIATFITEILVLTLTARIVYKHISFKIHFKVFYRALLAAILMGSVLLLLPNLNLFLAITIAALVYAGLSYLFGAITKDMIKMVLRKG